MGGDAGMPIDRGATVWTSGRARTEETGLTQRGRFSVIRHPVVRHPVSRGFPGDTVQL